jgi:hypothetical protein
VVYEPVGRVALDSSLQERESPRVVRTMRLHALTKLNSASFTGWDAGEGMSVIPMECIAGLTKKKFRDWPSSSSMVSHCVSCSPSAGKSCQLSGCRQVTLLLPRTTFQPAPA